MEISKAEYRIQSTVWQNTEYRVAGLGLSSYCQILINYTVFTQYVFYFLKPWHIAAKLNHKTF